jgi:hypothetical protein
LGSARAKQTVFAKLADWIIFALTGVGIYWLATDYITI